MKKTFEVGMTCKNSNGIYKVIGTNGMGRMTVKYLETGKAVCLNCKDEIENLKNTIFVKNEVNEESFYIALGFLAQSCYIQAETQTEYFNKFQKEYFEMTNEIVKNDKDNGVWVSPKKWKGGKQLRISFHKNIFENISNLFFEELICQTENHKGVCQVSNVKLICELFEMGFILGNEQNFENILSNIPSQYKDSFVVGYEIAKENKNKKIEKMIIGTKRVYRNVFENNLSNAA